MPSPTVVIDVAGLSKSLIGDAMPHLRSFSRGGCLCRLEPVLPAVTCPVQATMLTGTMPCDHGIVGNGWYDRELAEIHFWKQSSHLVAGEKVWETARRRDPAITCATLFWWYNMYSTADYSVTPRPIYKADGRKLPDCYSRPPELRTLLTERLGVFPLYSFWGPGSSIVSSRWIADAAKIVYDRYRPTLTLVYLPHLDYALQMLGPDHPDIGRWLGEIDEVVGDLLGFFEDRG
ncbi:MAG: alkaline phosphatase family protein, partial [Planctomycetes bacterium]|nr:alkaline phosphatase family protein [Planctomycetota bacterium]